MKTDYGCMAFVSKVIVFQGFCKFRWITYLHVTTNDNYCSDLLAKFNDVTVINLCT